LYEVNRSWRICGRRERKAHFLYKAVNSLTTEIARKLELCGRKRVRRIFRYKIMAPREGFEPPTK
jgi:hypothetical protein